MRLLRGGALIASLVVAAAPAAAQAVFADATLERYSPVTADRLENPDDGDWLTIRRTYNGWGYSPLAQINTENVSRLRPVWVASTGEIDAHEAPPIVSDGVMFVATPGSQVIALNAATGSIYWRYRRPIPEGIGPLHRTSRGIALYEDKVYFAAADAHLVALSARDGSEVWSAKIEEFSNGFYLTVAPLVADGKVMVGISGGERGVRGFVAAFDAQSGEEVWRTYVIPAPGEPGSESWPDDDSWRTGGGPTWVTGNYDPETNLLYWGTGNGSPWMGDQRPGDNLYTSSTLVLDAATGEIRSHFQYHPNDSWDWDENSPPLLIDFERDGRPVQGLVNVARNGYLWFLDRAEAGKGRIGFVGASPYVLQDVFRSIDPVTGRPDVDPDRKPGTGKTSDHCPSIWGGKNWPPAAFNPNTRMIYFPANNNLCGRTTGREVEYIPGSIFTGASIDMYLAPGAEHVGEVQAWNVDTGEKVWTRAMGMTGNWGPMLTTAGGLVFSGGTNDRMFRAFDAMTGDILWEFPTNSVVTAPASSFMVDGRQYIAVMSGIGTDARSMQARLNNIWPGEAPPQPEGGVIWVFAVE